MKRRNVKSYLTKKKYYYHSFFGLVWFWVLVVCICLCTQTLLTGRCNE